MAEEEIVEGTPQPEEQAVEQPASEEQAVPETEVGAEETAEVQSEEQEVQEDAPAEEATETVPDAPKQEAPAIPKELADAAANWQVWQNILSRRPDLRAQAQEEYQRMTQQAPPQQTRQRGEPLEEEALKREYNQLIEQGKVYEANRLLVQNDPEVVRARTTVSQLEAAEHAKAMETAAQKIAEHTKTFGSLEPDVKAEMTDMFSSGFKGDLVSARVAALVKLGRVKDAQNLLNKAATAKAPQRSAAAGGRVPAGKGAPPSKRVAKSAPTPGSGFTSEEVEWIERRAQGQGGGVL